MIREWFLPIFVLLCVLASLVFAIRSEVNKFDPKNLISYKLQCASGVYYEKGYRFYRDQYSAAILVEVDASYKARSYPPDCVVFQE